MSSRRTQDAAAGRLISRQIVMNRVRTRVLAPAPGEAGGAEPAWNLPGVCARARLQTSFGTVPTNLIRKGDPVRVDGGTYRPVRAVREYRFDADFLAQRPEALPVALRSASADAVDPAALVLLSPAQRLLVGGSPGDAACRLVCARDLGAACSPPETEGETLTYYRFLFEDTVALWVEGLWLECPRPAEGS